MVDKSRLAMVDVGDNANVAQILGHRFPLHAYYVPRNDQGSGNHSFFLNKPELQQISVRE
jgi:hypothetical protein